MVKNSSGKGKLFIMRDGIIRVRVLSPSRDAVKGTPLNAMVHALNCSDPIDLNLRLYFNGPCEAVDGDIVRITLTSPHMFHAKSSRLAFYILARK